jgi:cytochrome b6-f complex iron-sulfur subunit
MTWVGLGSLAGSLPIAMAACFPQPSDSSSSSSATGKFQVVGSLTDLDGKGQLLNEQVSNTKVLVFRNGADQLVAVNPVCTHAGCTVAWQADQNALICPCHRSIFTIDGKVLKGPATKPLATYAVKTEGESILVQV